MREDIARPETTSTIATWETLEEMVRSKAQGFVQQILEEEVTELLGREKSERRAEVNGPAGYRNGYGQPRRLAMSSGTITVRRPRVRGLEERFESRVLPLSALASGYRESTEAWSAVLRDFLGRGTAGVARSGGTAVLESQDGKRAGPSAEAVTARQAFAKRYRPRHPKAVDVLDDDWDRMVTFYDFPEAHWKHWRTTNPVESPFGSVRLRTSAAKRFKKRRSSGSSRR